MFEINMEIAEKVESGIYTLYPKRKGRSFIWNTVSEIVKEDGTKLEDYVFCRTCRRVLKNAKNQISNLSRHKCCLAGKTPPEVKTVTVEDKELATKVCAEWIIEDCRPFSCLRGSGFVKLIKFFIKIGVIYGEHVDIDYLLPDPSTIARKVQETADEKRKTLSSEIKDVVKNGGASVTIDMWPDRYINRNFLAVTLHYQKDFAPFSIVLGLKSMDFQKTTDENTWIKLTKLFDQFGIKDVDAIKFITDQNANIVKALESNTRLTCSSHLLAKVLDKSLEETFEVKETLEECKKLVKYFKKANLQNKLPTSVKNPCPTRWNSYYTMLKTIADNWNEINTMLKETGEVNRHFHINISILEVLVEICKHFEIIFRKLQVCDSPSLCFVLPSIYKIKSLCASDGSDIPAILILKENIVKNVDLIWVHNLSIWHMAAFFLFPPAVSKQQNDLKNIKEFCVSQITNFYNCKNTSISLPIASNSIGPETSSHYTSSEKAIDLIDIKDTCISDMPNYYNYESTSTSTTNSKCPETSATTFNTQLSTNDDISSTKDNDLIDVKDANIMEMSNIYNCETSSTSPPLVGSNLPSTSNATCPETSQSTLSTTATNEENQFFFSNWLDTSENSMHETVKDEVEKYGKEAVKMTENFDLIHWWKTNERHYPRLTKFALQIHSIPASCAASEHAFSLAGNIITEKRCRLEPKALDSLLFLNSYFKMYT